MGTIPVVVVALVIVSACIEQEGDLCRLDVRG
jgi:hypothetical protein